VYLSVRPASGLLSLADAGRVADGLRAGGLAVLPTETGYLLAALATSEDAVLAAFAVKDRPLSNVMHVACSSLEMAASIAQLPAPARRLLGELTPGPLTVVVRQTNRLPDRLVTLDGTVGIRVPDHPATLQVIAEVGAPVTATSLNRTGEPPSGIDRHALELLSWPPKGVVSVVEDDRSIAYALPSTLVRVTGPTLEILRPGPIAEEALCRVAGDSGGAGTRRTPSSRRS
jgi:L-threonylcarbamoyladenylate synthase